MIDGFRQPPRRGAVVTRNPLDVTPIRQKPSFKVVLGDMRMKQAVRADPSTHFRFRIRGIEKVSRAGVHVRQGDDSIRWLPPTEQFFNLGSKLFSYRDPTVVRKHIEAGHLASQPGPQKCC